LLALWAAGAAPPLQAQDAARFARKVDAVLARERLRRDQVSLLILSLPGRSVLYSARPDEPMIPASNAKLITSYAAMRQLTPNFRWKTRFYLVEEDDGPGRPHRQGLLVEAGADPTLRRGDLEAIARRLRALGLDHVDGRLWHDGRIFAGPAYPEAWGDVDLEMPWYAPVTPFILHLNQAAFTIRVRPGGAEPAEVQVVPEHPLPGMRVSAQFNWIAEGKEIVRVHEVPAAPEPTFQVRGDILPLDRTFTVATAVSNPLDHFLTQFRLALREAGIVGEAAPAPFEEANPVSVRELYVQESPPLGALLSEVNKESNNLVAEILLRSLASSRKRQGATAEDGLAVLRSVLAEDFPDHAPAIALRDGSGLSRDDRVTAAFLVALLERVLSRHEFRAEFLSSLSVGGWDGTLLDHSLPRRYWGRVRAKTGTLRGVQNISGYFHFGGRLLLFAFLIRDDARDTAALMRAQDRALAGILDAYLEGLMPPRLAKPGRPAPPVPVAPAKTRAPVMAGTPKTQPAAGAGR
jgi:D-alanyl-D-alanine carboxypeptidase/D-alanyl-D-alanine-endopeptidase (penicillin-binding protein 4)